MSIGYNSQDDEGSINFEENPNARLVCPECDDDVLISEYGDTWLCEGCFEEGKVTDLHTRIPVEELVSAKYTEKRSTQ